MNCLAHPLARGLPLKGVIPSEWPKHNDQNTSIPKRLEYYTRSTIDTTYTAVFSKWHHLRLRRLRGEGGTPASAY